VRLSAKFRMPFRRRREGKTNYKKRLALLKSGKTRLVVRKTNRRVIAQFVNYSEQGDQTVVMVDSRDLKQYGFEGKCNTPSAYLVGLLAGKMALKKGIKEAIADIVDVPTRGALVFAVVKGVVDAGVNVPFSADKVVVEDRLLGTHLGEDVKAKVESTKAKILEG